ncbi:hypothetical protein HA402_013656 [Bradysia odoriphaga]|nr:hypothetical protein HA402_013656 [Bradysia odoriphaga]
MERIINSGDTIFNYIGSGPPVTTGLHRYVFLLFKQESNNLNYDMVNGSVSIIDTSTRILIDEFNLTLVGGNFFLAQFEGVAGLVNDKFRDEEIVPDVLDALTVELQKLNVTYHSSGVSVDLGNVLTPSQVTDQPEVTWEAQPDTFYTILMTDPDAPSRQAPTLREYRHWLLMNVNGTDLSSGDIIFPYRGSGPPEGTSLHRYVFLVFRQANGSLHYEINDETMEPASTNTRKLISEFNLTLVGGNFFQAEYEGSAGTATINILMLSVFVFMNICVVFGIV